LETKDKELLSPGVYGLPQAAIKNTEEGLSNYKLTVILHPPSYSWKLWNIDSAWRNNGSSKLLARNQYYIEYSSESVSATGVIGYFIDTDSVLNIRCSEEEA
jgi:hypothetical protein